MSLTEFYRNTGALKATLDSVILDTESDVKIYMTLTGIVFITRICELDVIDYSFSSSSRPRVSSVLTLTLPTEEIIDDLYFRH